MLSRLALLAFALAACRTGDSGDASQPAEETAHSGPSLCVAVRGDDGHVMAQTAAIAKILELAGPIDALAGGGAAAPTLFLYDSMLANPAVKTCAGAPCSPADAATRQALMLKSLEGYLAASGASGAAVALLGPSRLVPALAATKLHDAVAANSPGARAAILAALNDSATRDVTLDTTRDWLKTSKQPARDAARLWKTLNGDRLDAFAPPVLGSRKLATALANVGDFYVGRGFETQWATFLDACAPGSNNATWVEIAARAAGQRTCGRQFLSLFQTARAKLPAAVAGDAPVGSETSILLSTALVTPPDTVLALESAFATGREHVTTAPPVAADALAFGLYGRPVDLNRVTANRRGFTDAKTRLTRAMPPSRWLDALAASLVDPGLTPPLRLDGGALALGGWADPHPTQVLSNLGCEMTVYVTRQGDDPAARRAESLGFSDDLRLALYGDPRQNPMSSRALALREAGGVWCSDWGAYRDDQILDLTENARHAPLGGRHLPARFASYDGARERLDEPGCQGGPPPETSASLFH